MLPRDHYLKQPFQDTLRFPDGFEKGGLSDIQTRLIRKHGTLISALSIDEVSDATPEDLHILKVIANQSAPKSPVEQAWIKYLAIIKNIANSGSSKGKPNKPKASKIPVEVPDEPEVKAIAPTASPTPTTLAKTKAAKPESPKATKLKPEPKLAPKPAAKSKAATEPKPKTAPKPQPKKAAETTNKAAKKPTTKK